MTSELRSTFAKPPGQRKQIFQFSGCLWCSAGCLQRVP